jgi:hypothetical protein
MHHDPIQIAAATAGFRRHPRRGAHWNREVPEKFQNARDPDLDRLPSVGGPRYTTFDPVFRSSAHP